MKLFTSLWRLFTSVQLAIATLITLAVTSVVGTLIPQGENVSYYSRFFANAAAKWTKDSTVIDSVADSAARITLFLHFDRMYSSWWYLGLLTVLALNLIICTIDRFPTAWKLIHRDPFSLSSERLRKMQHPDALPRTLTFERAVAMLATKGWKGEIRKERERTLFAAQKGRWGRLGVYLVHLSVIVIFIGGLIGSLFGFRAAVWVPELESTTTVYNRKDNRPIELPFAVHCNWFGIKYYNNGLPKEYESSLTLVADQKELTTRMIEVNGPLKYGGMTFYQSSFQPIPGSFVIILSRKRMHNDRVTKESFPFIAAYQRPVNFSRERMNFGILAAEGQRDRVLREKFWIKIGTGPPWSGWVDDNRTHRITVDGNDWEVLIKQRFATGLEVAKDPGVWVVYSGCLLMLGGLYLAFFMPHRRLWLLVTKKDETLVLAADSNKNRSGFAREVGRLTEALAALEGTSTPHSRKIQRTRVPAEDSDIDKCSNL